MLGSRVYIQEEMDDFDKKGEILNTSLNNLSFINKLLGNTIITLEAVKKILRNDAHKIYHIVDLGCGGGDNLRAIEKWCSENNRAVQLTGIDGNDHILDFAKQQDNNSFNYKQADILDAEFEIEPCDILISSHFVYRFTDIELVDFINKSSIKVRCAILFSELQRSVIPYYVFKFFGKLMPFNSMTVGDGLKAIRSSFKRKELRNILEQVQVKSFHLKWKWAFRYLVVIKL